MSVTSPVVALFKGALAYGVAGVLTRAVNLLLLPIYTAFLAPAEYGMLSLFAVLAAVVIPLASIGLGVSISLIYFEKKEVCHQAGVIWSAFTVLCATGLIVLAPLMIRSDLVSGLMFGQSDQSSLVVIATANAWLIVLGQPFATYLQLERRLSAYLFCAVATVVVLVSTSLWLVIELQRGVRGVLEAQLVSQVLSTIVFAGATWLRLAPGFSLALALRLVRYGMPLVPSFVSLLVLQQAPVTMVQAINGMDSLGIYAVGAALGAAMSIPVSGFTSAWPSVFLPYCSRPDAARNLIRRVSSLYILGMGSLSLLFFVWAQPVTFLMTSPSFRDAYLVVGLAACAQLFWGYFTVLLPAAYFAKDVRAVNVTQAIAALLFLPVCWYLIAWLPLLGAGFSLVSAGVLLCMVQYIWNRSKKRRYLQVKYDSGRLVFFGVFYVALATGYTLPNNMSFPSSIALSIIGTNLVIWAGYSQLAPADRRQLWTILRHAVKLRS